MATRQRNIAACFESTIARPSSRLGLTQPCVPNVMRKPSISTRTPVSLAGRSHDPPRFTGGMGERMSKRWAVQIGHKTAGVPYLAIEPIIKGSVVTSGVWATPVFDRRKDAQAYLREIGKDGDNRKNGRRVVRVDLSVYP